MTDQTFEEKVQKIAAEMRDAMRREDDGYPYAEFLSDMGDYIKDLESLLPAPSLPTLADMTEEERSACLRMQCDTAPNRSVRGFIAEVHPGGCRVIERDTWEWRSCSDDMVTPRPDLPRMEWPDDTATVPEGTLAVGSVWADAGALVEACRESGRDQIIVADKRGRVGVWDTVMRCWRVSAPHADFAPYAIIRAGKKDDQ